jgi:hypothetical protein
MLRPAELDRRDVDIIRKSVFSNNTFYVTSVTQASSAVRGGCPYLRMHLCTCSKRCTYQRGASVQGLQHDTAGVTLPFHVCLQRAMWTCLLLVRCADWSYDTLIQISDMAPPNAPVVPNGTAPGVFVRGTLRIPREGLFDIVNANLKQNFGGFQRDLCQTETQRNCISISPYTLAYLVLPM